jgi:hypothetical protein
MPYGVRIKGSSKKTGEVHLNLEPDWWDTHELMRNYHFDQTHVTDGYKDFSLDVSLEEMQAIHEGFRQAATSGTYADNGWQSKILPKLKEIDEILYSQIGNCLHFNIWIFEWESGY